MTYIAIDVHKSSSTFHWWIPGEAQFGRRCIKTRQERFRKLLDALPGPFVVAIEATRQAPAACSWLKQMDCEIHLVDPRKMAALNELMSAKTDDKDAASMLKALIHDYLPEAYLAPDDVVERRALTRGHTALRRLSTSVRNHLRIALCQAGIELTCTNLTGKTARSIVPGLLQQLPKCAGIVAQVYWTILQVLEQCIVQVDDEIKEQVAADPLATELCEHPGIGNVTALGLLGEIGEVARFPKDKKLHSYAGVAPKAFRTGDFAASGHLPQRCNKRLRYWAVTAAQNASRCKAPSKAKDAYERAKLKHNSNTAKIVAARAILSFLYHLARRTAVPDQGPVTLVA